VLSRHFAIAIGLSLTLPVSGAAQRPNFSGEWTRVDQDERPSVAAVGDAAFRTGSMGSAWGSPLTIRQDSGRVIIEYPFFSAYDLQPPIRLVYALDGSESRNDVMIGHATSRQRSRAVWRDGTLIITTTFTTPDLGGGDTTAELRQAITLESPNRLLVETIRTGVPGIAADTIRSAFTRGASR
jgi:hypothetical protein